MNENDKLFFGQREIENMIPHRNAALLIDTVEYDPSVPDCAIGYLEIREDNPWIQGHFPGRPIYPGHCHIECANLVAAILARHLFPHLQGLPMVVKVEKVCHKEPVVIGDKLQITVKLVSQMREKVFTFNAVIIDENCKVVTTIEKIVGVIASVAK